MKTVKHVVLYDNKIIVPILYHLWAWETSSTGFTSHHLASGDLPHLNGAPIVNF